MGLAMRLPGLSIHLRGLELTYTSIVCTLMRRGDSTVHRRINVTLPEETVKLMDRVSEKGDRSRLINEAVNRYIGGMRRANLRKLLRAGALRRAARDRRLAEDWFLLEDDAWHS
jgi:CopG family transcriptional regulator / antitoxin EndoAI